MFNIKEFFNLNFYISELDQFLVKFERDHPKLSQSQLKERQKHDRVFALRDKSTRIEPNQDVWDKF